MLGHAYTTIYVPPQFGIFFATCTGRRAKAAKEMSRLFKRYHVRVTVDTRFILSLYPAHFSAYLLTVACLFVVIEKVSFLAGTSVAPDCVGAYLAAVVHARTLVNV